MLSPLWEVALSIRTLGRVDNCFVGENNLIKQFIMVCELYDKSLDFNGLSLEDSFRSPLNKKFT